MRVCSVEYLFHTLLNTGDEIVESILTNGLRPLSDFPGSARWQQIERQMPGFFENLYEMIARPVLQNPYTNSGVFVSPIDFRLLPESILHSKTRVKIPVSRLDPSETCITYVWEEERISLPYTLENLQRVADFWTAARVTAWFARDQTRVFYYVPQIASYQAGGIPVQAADIERF